MGRDDSFLERTNEPKINRFLSSNGVIGIGIVTSLFSGNVNRDGGGGLILGFIKYWRNGSSLLSPLPSLAIWVFAGKLES